jgi:hypothetical protein
VTGSALYRYVDTREDLLDLMIDVTGSEYVFAAPTGDWLADLLAIGDQATPARGTARSGLTSAGEPSRSSRRADHLVATFGGQDQTIRLRVRSRR